MSEKIEVQVARDVDREAVVAVLRKRGIEAEPIDGDTLAFRIPCADGGSDDACVDLVAQMEDLIAGTHLPLVPQAGDGFVFLRPPGD